MYLLRLRGNGHTNTHTHKPTTAYALGLITDSTKITTHHFPMWLRLSERQMRKENSEQGHQATTGQYRVIER